MPNRIAAAQIAENRCAEWDAALCARYGRSRDGSAMVGQRPNSSGESMRKGESRIVFGASLAVGFIVLLIVAARARNFDLPAALICFFVPAFSTALILSGVFRRMNDRDKSS